MKKSEVYYFHFQNIKNVKDCLALRYIWFTCTEDTYFEDLRVQLEMILIQGQQLLGKVLIESYFHIC